MIQRAYEKAGDAWDEESWVAASARAITLRRSERVTYLLDHKLVADEALKVAVQLEDAYHRAAMSVP